MRAQQGNQGLEVFGNGGEKSAIQIKTTWWAAKQGKQRGDAVDSGNVRRGPHGSGGWRTRQKPGGTKYAVRSGLTERRRVRRADGNQ